MVATRLLVLILASLLYPLVSRAQLGQPVQKPTRQWGSLKLQNPEAHSAEGFRYNVYSSGDLVVKQYVNPATNEVFGITWKGRHMPSLLALLGFDPYKITGPGVSRSLHVTSIRTDKLSIAIVALMGHHSGRALRVDLLPQGVSASVVKP